MLINGSDGPAEWIDLSSDAEAGEPLVAWQEDHRLFYGPASTYRFAHDAYVTGHLDPPRTIFSAPYSAWVDDDGLVVDNGAGPIPRWW